jgi:hypothetical protein
MKKIKRFFVLALTVIKRVIAVLDFPDDIDDFIIYARGIHDSMVASSYFSGLSAKLATLLTNIARLEATHTGLQTHPPTTTTAQRNGDLHDVQNNLRGLRMDVQGIADADVDNAEDIITSAGMKVKKQGAINKQDFVAKDGEVTGSVKLVAKGIETSHAAHDWAMSTDGTNWTPVTPTLAATTVVSGLTKGAIVDFRHREILKDGPTDWLEINDWVVK